MCANLYSIYITTVRLKRHRTIAGDFNVSNIIYSWEKLDEFYTLFRYVNKIISVILVVCKDFG